MFQNQLKTIIKEEEIKWIQRAKEKELLEGDNNTRYYHSKANGRRRKTLIVSLNQDEGLIECQENLKRYITDFYKKLFGNPDLNDIRFNNVGIERLNEEDCEFLMKDFTMEDLMLLCLKWQLIKQLAQMGLMQNSTKKLRSNW
jgi:hypothetical protein